MTTIRDVAAAAGVSLGTASRALSGNGYTSDATRALVLETAQRLGYTPRSRKTARKQRRKAVGVVLPDLSFPFWGSFLKYVEAELGNRGYSTMVCNMLGVPERLNHMLELVEQQELDGLILNANVTHEAIDRLKQLPVVSFECILDSKIPMVASDHIEGGRMAAQLLLERGCKDVMILSAVSNTPRYADYRIVECRKRLEEQGVKVTVAEFNGSMITYSSLQEVSEQYMSIYKGVDGIFTEDISAYCCVRYALERGIRIPEELRVVGYDGNEITQLIRPRITTIAQDTPQLAAVCVDTLFKVLDGEPVPEITLIPVTMQRNGTA